MNITRLNFPQTLPFIKNIIKQSHFVSIDLEMSGIVANLESQPSLVDSVHFLPSRSNNDTLKPNDAFKTLSHYKSVSAVTQLIPPTISNFSTNHRVKFYPFNFYVYPLSVYES